MSDTPPYSEATRAYVEEKIRMLCGDGKVPDGAEVAARVVLNGLARRGRLLPEGAIREHAVRYLNTGTVTHPVSSAESARLIAKAWRDDEGIECEPVERLVGPWSAVPPEPKEGT